MIFHSLPLKGAFRIEFSPRGDERGRFTRLFCLKELATIGHTENIAQINHSRTMQSGTIRGMHYQYPPKGEVKIVICLRGRVFDVAVDLRKGSQTFLGWHGEELSEDNNSGMYIPKGFAHGFQAMEEYCELLYFHTEYYLPEFEGGVRYDDEAINIQWPRQPKNVSQRDMSHPKIHLIEFGGLEL